MEKYIISDLVIENLCFESGKSYSADGENCFFERTNGRISITKIKIGSDRIISIVRFTARKRRECFLGS